VERQTRNILPGVGAKILSISSCPQPENGYDQGAVLEAAPT
jgi:hypothetical protein